MYTMCDIFARATPMTGSKGMPAKISVCLTTPCRNLPIKASLRAPVLRQEAQYHILGLEDRPVVGLEV